MARERFIADTSYVGAAQRVAERRADYGWSSSTTARLGSALIAVSVVTVGEVRSGNLVRGLEQRRVRASERWLNRFPRLDVDEAIAHMWAQMEASGHRLGLRFSDNDLWVAATAQTLGVPVITCDRAFARIPDLDVEVIYLASGHTALAGGARLDE